MKSFIRALYLYAHENRIPRYLHTPEYRRAVFGLEEAWEAFREALTEEQEQALDLLLSKESEIQRLEDEASFCSALSIGVSLGRL